MSLSTLMVLVVVVCIMARARDFKGGGGRPCSFCHRYSAHAPDCPARGAGA